MDPLTHRARRHRRHRRHKAGGSFVCGFVLVGLGVWFLVDRAGFDVPGVDQLWPLFVILGGLSMLGSFVLSGLRDSEQVASGVAAFLIGIFFLFFTMGPLDWSMMAALWPVFPLLSGIAMVARFVASLGRQPQSLVRGLGAMAVGVIGLAVTLTPLGSMLLSLGWPVILVLVGLLVLMRALFGSIFRSAFWFSRRVS